jgi:hypothetical protein
VCVIQAAEMNNKGEYKNYHMKNQDVSNEIIKKKHIIGNDGLKTWKKYKLQEFQNKHLNSKRWQKSSTLPKKSTDEVRTVQ